MTDVAQLKSNDNSEVDRVVEIERLAALQIADYEVIRKTSAENLNMRTSVLDKEVKRKRRELGLEKSDEARQGQAVTIQDILPWPEEIDSDHLAESIRATVRRYAVITDAGADAITLWILLSWTIDNFSFAPRLAVTSPTKGCGKTTILRILSKLTRRPLKSGCLTAAVLFRALEILKPTLILDENEKYLEPNTDTHAILNEGHCRGAKALRVLGESQELRAFDIFGLVAFARNGKIPDDLEQRSITIEMQRRLPGEPLAELREDRCEQLDNLARMACRWADDYGPIINDCDPNMGGIINRVADNWRPLFALADAIGSDWPQRVREAYTALMPSSDRADSNDTMLLQDIRTVFEERGTDKLSSEQIVDALIAMEGHPWAEYGKSGKPITKNKLAYRLDRFKIKSENVRIGTVVPKGYHRHQFEEAWGRYLAPCVDPPNETLQRYNADGIDVSGAFQNATSTATEPLRAATEPLRPSDPEPEVAFQEPSVASCVASHVAFQKCKKPPSNGHCSDVAFQKGEGNGSVTSDVTERDVLMCGQCGFSGPEVMPFAWNGYEANVHPHCQDAWVASKGDDLTIPTFLDRRAGAV